MKSNWKCFLLIVFGISTFSSANVNAAGFRCTRIESPGKSKSITLKADGSAFIYEFEGSDIFFGPHKQTILNLTCTFSTKDARISECAGMENGNRVIYRSKKVITFSVEVGSSNESNESRSEEIILDRKIFSNAPDLNRPTHFMSDECVAL